MALVCKDPYRTYAKVVTRLYPGAVRPQSSFGESGVSPHALIHPTARLGDGVGGDLHPLAEAKMRRDRGLAADRDEILERRRAGDADLRHDHAMLADGDVVGDLHQVVDLRPLPDQRVAAAAAVDRRVGADLDVVADDHAPELRHL